LSLGKNPRFFPTGERSINVLGKAGGYGLRLEYNTADDVVTPFFFFLRRVGEWQGYKKGVKKILLPYPNLPSKGGQNNFVVLSLGKNPRFFPTGESCLYAIRHYSTGNFYIGETQNYLLDQRIGRHKNMMRRVQYPQF